MRTSLTATLAVIGMVAAPVAVATPAAASPSSVWTAKQCIYMKKPDGRFMVWSQNGRSISGAIGAPYAEYNELKLRINSARTSASGVEFLYPDHTRDRATYKLVGTSSTKTMRAKGWQRITKAQFQRHLGTTKRFTPDGKC